MLYRHWSAGWLDSQSEEPGWARESLTHRATSGTMARATGAEAALTQPGGIGEAYLEEEACDLGLAASVGVFQETC